MISCAFRFEGVVRDAVHRLKYRGERHLAEPLVAAVLDALGEDWARQRSGLEVVPVPLHPMRQRARGYNQGELLAASLARRLGGPLAASGLARVRDTPEQARLPAASRARNVQGAFALADARLSGAKVLLVDDVATTTATLRAAASALRTGGVAEVEAFVIARAVKVDATASPSR